MSTIRIFNSPQRKVASMLLLSLLFIMLSFGKTKAQQANDIQKYQIKRYRVERGFATNTVYQSLTDSKGYIWMATAIGLVRFDGVNCVNYNVQNSTIIKEEELTHLMNYSDDTLLVFANSNLSDNNNYLVYHSRDSDIIVSLSINQLRIGGLNPKAIAYKNFNKQDKNILLKSDVINALKTGFSFGNDLQRLYIYHAGSIYYLSEGCFQKIDILSDNLADDIMFLIGKTFIHIRSNKTYGVFKPGESLIYKPLAALDTFFFSQSSKKTIVKNTILYSSACGIINHNKGEIYDVQLNENDDLTLHKIDIDINQTNISDFNYDKKNDLILISTLDDGLKVCRKNVFSNYDKGLIVNAPNRYIISVLSIDRKRLFTTYGILNEKGKMEVKFKDLNPGASSSALFKSEHFIYYSKQNKLIRYNLLDDSIKIILDSIPRLNCMFKDQQNDIWIVLESQLGKLNHDSFQPVLKAFTGNESATIWTIKQMDSDRLEILTSIGVYTYYIKENRVSRSKLFDKLILLDIVADFEGGWWIATYGSGYYYLTNDHLISLPLDQAKNLIYTQNITLDKKGWLWISTNNGLMRLNRNDLLRYCQDKSQAVTFYNFGREEGLISNVLYGNGNPSVTISEERIVYYPTIKGITYTKLDEIEPYLPSGEIFVDQILVDGKQYQKPEITLEPKFKNLEIKLSVPYLGNRVNLELSYLLKGFSTDWKIFSNGAPLIFNSLPSGTYHLVIRYPYYNNTLGHSVWAMHEIKIVVLKSFYQKLWFQVLMILVLLGLFYAIYRVRTVRLIKQKARLEKIVDERTQELKNTIADYENSTEQLFRSQQKFDTLFTTVLHDLSSPLRFLGNISTRLKNQWRVLPEAEVDAELESLSLSTIEASHIAQDLLLWMKVQKEEMDFKKDQIILKKFVDDNIKLYRWIAEEKGLNLSTSISDNIYIYINPELLGIVIRNLTDNAVKYSSQGNIEISAYETQKSVSISITDSGRGMDQHHIQNLNKGSSPFKLETSGKMGLKLVFDVMQTLEGSIIFSNRDSGGLQVILSFKKPAAE